MQLINNPYTKELQEAYRLDNKDKIKELEQKSHEFTKSELSRIDTETEKIGASIPLIQELPKKSQQYKESCRIYKQVFELLLQIREVKKSIRDSMKTE